MTIIYNHWFFFHSLHLLSPIHAFYRRNHGSHWKKNLSLSVKSPWRREFEVQSPRQRKKIVRYGSTAAHNWLMMSLFLCWGWSPAYETKSCTIQNWLVVWKLSHKYLGEKSKIFNWYKDFFLKSDGIVI